MNRRAQAIGSSTETVRFTGPRDTEISLPVDEIFIEIPEYVAKDDKILEVRGLGSDTRTFYISERSLLQRFSQAQLDEALASGIGSQHREADHKDDIRSDGARVGDRPHGLRQLTGKIEKQDIEYPQKRMSKREKEIQDLQDQVAMCTQGHRNEEIRRRTVERHNQMLRKEIAGLKRAYESKRSRADWLHRKYEQEYLRRVKNETDMENMRQQIFKLRSDIEEASITDATLVDNFEDLVNAISDCINFLKFHIPAENRVQLESLRSELNFDLPSTSDLDIFEHRLPTVLFELLQEGVRAYFCAGITDWFDAAGDENTRIPSDAFLQFENEVLKKANSEEAAVEPETSLRKDKTHAAAQKDVNLLNKAFYRWRSTTVRLLGLVDSMYPSPHDGATRRSLAKTISSQFLGKIQVQELNPDEALEPWSIFRSAEDIDDDRAKKTLTRYMQKVEGCVSRAMKFRINVRSCHAFYTFNRLESSVFNPLKMETQQLSDMDPDNVQATVLYCRYPSIVKHGNDDGDQYNRSKTIKKADVVIANDVIITDAAHTRAWVKNLMSAESNQAQDNQPISSQPAGLE